MAPNPNPVVLDPTTAQQLSQLSPHAAARVGALLLSRALERDPSVLADPAVATDVLAVGHAILAVEQRDAA